jgi:hypothetical protein
MMSSVSRPSSRCSAHWIICISTNGMMVFIVSLSLYRVGPIYWSSSVAIFSLIAGWKPLDSFRLPTQARKIAFHWCPQSSEMNTIPARETVAGVTYLRSWISKMMRMCGRSVMRSLDARFRVFLSDVHHAIHRLDPVGIEVPVEKNPLGALVCHVPQVAHGDR